MQTTSPDAQCDSVVSTTIAVPGIIPGICAATAATASRSVAHSPAVGSYVKKKEVNYESKPFHKRPLSQREAGLFRARLPILHGLLLS